MTSKTVGKVKLTTDASGKVKLARVHSFDASKKRRVAKSKKQRVVAPAKAGMKAKTEKA